MKIGYIITMRMGLPSFVYREISLLNELGHEVFPYIMRSGEGPYMPEPNWPIRNWNPITIIKGLFFELLYSPLRFINQIIWAAILGIAISSGKAWPMQGRKRIFADMHIFTITR